MFKVGLISRISNASATFLFLLLPRKPLTFILKSFSETCSPPWSSPGKFYGTAKIHKVPGNGNIDHLPIRPIVSNLNTAAYQLAKHLSKILSPLRESEYTIKSKRQFLEII